MNKSIKVIILSKFNPDKLKVDFRRGVTQYWVYGLCTMVILFSMFTFMLIVNQG